MRSYQGTRTTDGAHVTRQTDETAAAEELPLRLDLWDHSPTGFEWGYGGSGPAQLALALLADALDDEEKAIHLHQAFKWEVVGKLPHVSWTLTDAEIRQVAEDLERRQHNP